MRENSMRDPERIDSVLAQIRVLWKQYPDLRLTQLIYNAAGGVADDAPFFYNVEDDALLQRMRKTYG